jgi:hypothetical protein
MRFRRDRFTTFAKCAATRPRSWRLIGGSSATSARTAARCASALDGAPAGALPRLRTPAVAARGGSVGRGRASRGGDDRGAPRVGAQGLVRPQDDLDGARDGVRVVLLDGALHRARGHVLRAARVPSRSRAVGAGAGAARAGP